MIDIVGYLLQAHPGCTLDRNVNYSAIVTWSPSRRQGKGLTWAGKELTWAGKELTWADAADGVVWDAGEHADIDVSRGRQLEEAAQSDWISGVIVDSSAPQVSIAHL